MDLKTFPFPKATELDIAFSTYDTNKELLEEAKSRGFLHGRTPYNDLFSELFFNGGKISFKDGVEEDFKNNAWPYCRGLMRSFAPKHEHKEAVCAMLMSELLEPKLQKA